MFSLRLKELRTETGLNQEEFGKRINRSRSSIASYETTDRYPDIDILLALAEEFNVSIDWLLGISSSKKKYDEYDFLYQDKLEIIRKTLIDEKLLDWSEPLPPEYLDTILQHGLNSGITVIKLLKQNR